MAMSYGVRFVEICLRFLVIRRGNFSFKCIDNGKLPGFAVL
jgi:hypothetical protein